MSLLSTHPISHCPMCGSPATRIHSRYQRRLADLPSTGQPVHFLLNTRKFFCEVPTHPRKNFAERLGLFVAPWTRVTAQLFQMVQIVSLLVEGLTCESWIEWASRLVTTQVDQRMWEKRNSQQGHSSRTGRRA